MFFFLIAHRPRIDDDSMPETPPSVHGLWLPGGLPAESDGQEHLGSNHFIWSYMQINVDTDVASHVWTNCWARPTCWWGGRSKSWRGFGAAHGWHGYATSWLGSWGYVKRCSSEAMCEAVQAAVAPSCHGSIFWAECFALRSWCSDRALCLYRTMQGCVQYLLLLQVVEKAPAAILFVHFALDVVSTYLHLLF